MREIPRFKLVWATLPIAAQTGATIPFPDVPELRGKRIFGVECYAAPYLAATPDLVACSSLADITKMTLVLRDGIDERVQDIPCATLYPQYVAGIYKQFTPFVVNWQSSFVRIVQTVTGAQTVAFGVMYLD